MKTYNITEENYYLENNGKRRRIGQIMYTWQRHPEFDSIDTLMQYLTEKSQRTIKYAKKPTLYIAYIDIIDTENNDSFVNDTPSDVLIATLKPASNNITFKLLSSTLK